MRNAGDFQYMQRTALSFVLLSKVKGVEQRVVATDSCHSTIDGFSFVCLFITLVDFIALPNSLQPILTLSVVPLGKQVDDEQQNRFRGLLAKQRPSKQRCSKQRF